MSARSIRIAAAAAAVPAATVIVAHLALVWARHPSPADRQASAFDHGIALAIVLTAALVASRYALAAEGESSAPLADAITIVAAVGLLAHMAAVWRDRGVGLDTVPAAVAHLALLAVAVLAAEAVRAREARTAQSRANRGRL